MIPVLIAFSTAEGQTRKVAEFMAGVLAASGYRADVVDVASERAALVQPIYAAAIVGGSVHMGRHSGELTRFLRANAAWLATVPLAFFSVSLTAARDDGAGQAAASRMIDDALAGTDLVPACRCRIGGALRFDEYGPAKRMLARRAARDVGAEPGTDTEFTDWDGVRRFVVAFVRGYDKGSREVA
jgi:menaquinone-dependent protoporphyrinogen oxidase